MNDQAVDTHLQPGETLKASRRIHGFVLLLPAFFLVVGSLQFTPWSFGVSTQLAGWVAIAYGLFTTAMFGALYLDGRVALTDKRLIYIQKFPGRTPDLSAWTPRDFDNLIVRRGVLGSWLGYGHLLLTKSGRMVTVIRSVRNLDSLAAQIRTDLLNLPAVSN